jgi:TRAP-type mannitol/chloroaromatic compound transport system substrate-binding protein
MSGILFDTPAARSGCASGGFRMDRRDFLKVGGAAAVTAGAGTAATAVPVIRSDATTLHLAARGIPDWPGFGPERLARRIELATGGRFRIIDGADPAEADLVFGPVSLQCDRHPAFAFFAGLPLSQGFDAASHQTWLAAGGGQMLWDELAARFGFKPLIAGHTGTGAGLWAARRLETVADLAGARLHVEGVAADVVRALGATPMQIDTADIRAALAEGRLDAAEYLGPSMMASPDLQPLAGRLYHPGLHANGTLVSLDVRADAWQRLGPADQAIFEACAAEAYQLSLVETQAHALMAAQIETPSKWPARQPMTRELSDALEAAARHAVARIAAFEDARRIHDSHAAFRAMLGEPRTV